MRFFVVCAFLAFFSGVARCQEIEEDFEDDFEINAAPITCYSGVYTIVARGTLKPQYLPPEYGEGSQYPISVDVTNRIPGSHHEALIYPASLSFLSSYHKGVVRLLALISNYSETCPNPRFVLMGSSQGAAVVADVLCGSIRPTGPYSSPPLSDKYAANIKSVVLMGDPTHMVGMGWNANNTEAAKTNGDVTRTVFSYCARFYNRAISWCDTGDQYCSKTYKYGVHTSYVKKYGAQTVDFVVNKVNNPPIN